MSTSQQRAGAETEPEQTVQAEGPGAGARSLPVLAEEARVVHAELVGGEVVRGRELAALPAVQAAAVAAGGFVAGAAVVGLVARHRRSHALAQGRRAGRRLARGGGRRRASGAGELVQIVGSRSLLLDVHLLGARD